LAVAGLPAVFGICIPWAAVAIGGSDPASSLGSKEECAAHSAAKSAAFCVVELTPVKKAAPGLTVALFALWIARFTVRNFEFPTDSQGDHASDSPTAAGGGEVQGDRRMMCGIKGIQFAPIRSLAREVAALGKLCRAPGRF
jgi:hypothetical protein